MAQLLPTNTEIAGFTNIGNVVTWAGLNGNVWTAISNFLGGMTQIRMMAALPLTLLRQALRDVRINTTAGTDRELTAAETIQVGLIWRASRKACGLDDLDPLVDTAPSTVVAAAPPGTAAKKIKASSVVDQLDDSDITLLSRTELDACYVNHVEITGAEPAQDAEPTPEQVAGLKERILGRGESPYADFSVLTPFGRRVQKQMKARSWILQQDGAFKGLDIPGPPSFQAWGACWKVYRAIIFMLRHPAVGARPPKQVATPASLEEYHENISRLVEEFPEAWHLVMQAEDRCRAEVFERHRRNLTKARAEGRLPMGLDFDPAAPWTGVFIYAARDSEFWNKRVIRPAHSFIARGGKHMSLKSAENTNIPEQAKHSLNNIENATSSAGADAESPSKRKRKQKLQRLQEENLRLKSGKNNAGQDAPLNKQAQSHPKKWGTHYITDSDGTEICFRFAKGELGSCKDPCQDHRSHCCQHCLGNHPNSMCPNRKKSSGKGHGKAGERVAK